MPDAGKMRKLQLLEENWMFKTEFDAQIRISTPAEWTF
jgi:hypothetical protein